MTDNNNIKIEFTFDEIDTILDDLRIGADLLFEKAQDALAANPTDEFTIAAAAMARQSVGRRRARIEDLGLRALPTDSGRTRNRRLLRTNSQR